MFNNIKIVLFALIIVLPFAAMSAQGDGSNADMKDVCELSGGTFTGSSEGTWACCWANWGCYGCISGSCKMKCDTARCRRANGQVRVTPGYVKPKGFEHLSHPPVIPAMNPKPKTAPNKVE